MERSLDSYAAELFVNDVTSPFKFFQTLDEFNKLLFERDFLYRQEAIRVIRELGIRGAAN
jgi:hypothetical protein